MATFNYRRGEPIIIDLVITDVGSYDPADFTVEMKLKHSTNNDVPPKTTAYTGTFTVSYVPASGTEDPYWRGTIAGEVTAGYVTGIYVTDAVLSLGGDVVAVTEPQIIRLRESVTPA